MSFEHVLQPIKIGPVNIKNRIVMAPLNIQFSDGKGFVTEQDIGYLAARAKGGAGLIISGAVHATREGARRISTRMPHLFSRAHIPGFQEMTERIHEFDAKLFLQLTAGFGRQARTPGTELVAPSAIPNVVPPEMLPKAYAALKDYIPYLEGSGVGIPGVTFMQQVPREMTITEILEREDEMAESARLTEYAGVDGIEIHAPHGYLISQFLSPRCNKRTDVYGGSLENRMRFLIETLEKIRSVVEDRLAVIVRLSAQEHMPGGFTIEETKVIAKECERVGADAIHLSDGSGEALKYFFPEEESDHLVNEAMEIKKGLKIPVITPSIHDPEHAERAISEGKTDMISLGRQLLADPEWANKVRGNRIGEIIRCKRDLACLAWLFAGCGARCTVNPNLGRERFMPEYWPQKKSAVLPASLIKKTR